MIAAPPTAKNSQTHFSEQDLVASICRSSFYEFVKEFWHEVIVEEPALNWHIEYLCDELQEAAERVFLGLPKLYDIIINISPGTTKSTIVSIMFPAWVWTRMIHARTISTSYALNVALEMSGKSRDIIQSDKYLSTFPEIQLRADANAKGEYRNTEKGHRYAVGMGGSVTGKHAHFIIIDDPLNPKEAASEAELKNANAWMTGTIPTRKVDKDVALTIIIMQRLHQNDPSGHQLDLQKKNPDTYKIRHICIPAERSKHIKPRKLRQKYCPVTGLMDPKRLSRKVLDEAKVINGEYHYAGQFGQHPIPAGGGMFKIERINVEPQAPKHWKARVRYWDKAGTANGGAYTVGVWMGKDEHDRIWILDVVRGQWTAGDREPKIKQAAVMDGKSVIVGVEQEPGSGGKESAQSTAKNLAGWRVRIDRPTGDKIYRADPFSVQVSIGNVYMVKAEWNAVYLDELQYFPHSTYKDQVDASSGAFALVTKGSRKVGAMA